MDAIDIEILSLLNNNSRITISDIGKEINLSIPAVSERIRKLEHYGVIEQYTVKLNRKACHYSILAFIQLTIKAGENIEYLRKYIQEHAQVLEFHHVTGEFDYLLKVLARDMDDLEQFITVFLKQCSGVNRSSTMIVLSTITEKINAGAV